MGWVHPDDARGVKVAEVESVGWIMAMSKRGIQIAPHVVVSGSSGVQGYMTIPRSGILVVRVLDAVISSCASAPSRKRQLS